MQLVVLATPHIAHLERRQAHLPFSCKKTDQPEEMAHGKGLSPRMPPKIGKKPESLIAHSPAAPAQNGVNQMSTRLLQKEKALLSHKPWNIRQASCARCDQCARQHKELHAQKDFRAVHEDAPHDQALRLSQVPVQAALQSDH